MAAESSGFRLVRRLVKALAIGLGFVTTLLSLMAVVGLLTENGWIRVLVALVVALAVPAVLSDRLLPDDVERARGLPSDVFARVWIGFPLAFAVGFNAATRALLDFVFHNHDLFAISSVHNILFLVNFGCASNDDVFHLSHYFLVRSQCFSDVTSCARVLTTDRHSLRAVPCPG